MGSPITGFSARLPRVGQPLEFQRRLPLTQEAAHGVVAFETDRHFVCVAGFAICAGSREKFGTGCPVRLIFAEACIVSNFFQFVERDLRTIQLRNRQRAIDGNHRGRGESQQHVVKLHYLLPVGVTGATAIDVRRLQCGFQLIPADGGELARAAEKGSASKIICESHNAGS